LIRVPPQPNLDLVDWLLACPTKGHFAPIDSGSTDEIRGFARSVRAGSCAANLEERRNGA
jgi:hypothetical protein